MKDDFFVIINLYRQERTLNRKYDSRKERYFMSGEEMIAAARLISKLAHKGQVDKA